jgi:hypothetical protein
MLWITVQQLEQALTARRDLLPALLDEVIRASAREIATVRFPSREKSQIHGFDGHLIAAGVPHLQDGESLWELGTGGDYFDKAEGDIQKRSAETPVEMRNATTFVFSTSRTWDQQGERELQSWKREKKAQFGWKDVVVIDGVMLTAWVNECDAVASRYARREFGLFPEFGARSTSEFWNEYSARFKVPINESVLICGKEEQSKRLLDLLKSGGGSGSPLVLRADSLDEAVAFVVATVRKADPDIRAFFEARTVVLDSNEAARELANKRNLIFVARGSVTTSDYVARTAPTVTVIGRDRPDNKGYLSIAERPPTDVFAEALRSMGIAEDESRLLARASGRSATILMRRFPNGTAPIPEWKKAGADLLPALLAGAWDSSSDEDRKIVCLLAGVDSYEKYEALVRPFQRMEDAPIDREESTWKMRAPVDAFVNLAHLLGPEHFDRLRRASNTVFSEMDPSLDNPIPPNSFNLPRPRHSSWLRDGLATTLLQIAVSNEGADFHLSGMTPQNFVDDLITNLPGLSADARLIASLRAELPLLAEVAPLPFLEALERLLDRGGEVLTPIFREGGFFSPSSPHVYLLWGLEALAWDPEYLARVSLILVRLAKADPGGTVANRPLNSLCEIFLPVHPSTNAPQAMRLAVLDKISHDVPDVGWQLIRKLLPTSNIIGHYTPKPKYREAGGSKREILTYGMAFDAYAHIVEQALTLAGSDPERWHLLIRGMHNFNPELRSKTYGMVERVLETATEEQNNRIWTDIRDEVNRHVAFKDAKWALPADELNRLSELVERFAPTDPIEKVSWLFDNPFPDLPGKRDNPERAAVEAREQALSEISKTQGISAALRLAASVKMPRLVAVGLRPLLTEPSAYGAIIGEALDKGGTRLDEFAAALSAEVVHRFPEEAASLIRSRIEDSKISGDRLLSLFTYWPDDRSTWDFIAGFGNEIELAYWSRKNAWPVRGGVADLTYAAEHYLHAGRGLSAIHSLGEEAAILPAELVFALLNSSLQEISKNPDDLNGMFTYYLDRILDKLEERDAATILQIAQIEYKFLPLFEYGERRHLRLHRVMSEDPATYVMFLCHVFKAENEEPTEPTDEQRARASAAYQLLRSFDTLPGSDGQDVDGGRLGAWTLEVKRLGEEAKRKAMTHQFIGHVLAHAPKDPADGAWPHRSVRDLLETLQSDDSETGIQVERFNMRGVYTKALFEGGKQENAFAAEARDWAGKCAAWPRTFKLLNNIAHQWEEHAKREDSRAKKDRMRD